MNIKQQAGESFLDWKHRLLILKMNKEINQDWVEIRDILELNCSPDHLRKMAYGIAEYHTNIQSKAVEEIEDESIIQEIEEKTIVLEKSRFKMADQRRELNNIKRWEARLEELEERMILEIERLALVKPIIFEKPNPNKKTSSGEGVLLLSDWHKGLTTENYWNSFNDGEFERRIKRLTEKTIEYSRTHGASSKLNVFGLGDFVNGIIHVTTRISNSEDVVRQTMSVSETLAEMLAVFSSEFKEVVYYHTRGNHDRVMANKHDEIAKESFADLIPFYLKARLIGVKNVSFPENKYDDEIITAEVCGKMIFAVHGHRDRITSVVQNLALMTKITPDYVVMGHYHHHEENEVQGIEVIINSTLSGVDSYAKDIRKTSNPAQKLMIFTPEEGRLCTYNIRFNI